MPRWNRRPEARASELLAVALRCFSAKGIDAVTLDDIAKQAGVTKGTFYHYFRSKAHLLRELIRGYAAPKAHQLEVIAKGPGSASERLELLLRAHWHVLTDTPMRYLPRLLLTAAPRHPQLARDAMQHGISVVKRAYRRCISDGIKHGEFRSLGGSAMVEVCILPLIARAMLADTALSSGFSSRSAFITAHCAVVRAALTTGHKEIV